MQSSLIIHKYAPPLKHAPVHESRAHFPPPQAAAWREALSPQLWARLKPLSKLTVAAKESQEQQVKVVDNERLIGLQKAIEKVRVEEDMPIIFELYFCCISEFRGRTQPTALLI